MNRANQQALFQATNQGLLGIRQQELNYYLNLNLAFGTQAALIGGFTYGVFTQNPLNNDNNYGEVINDVCWVTSAATIATAVHVILNTMLLQVYGPGLALHGPVGSIARATEGMKIEQKQIVTSFMLMMFFFSVSTTLSFWVVMNLESAAGSTAVFIIAARYWYYYTERIYLRFYWDTEKDQWNEGNEGGENEYMPPAVTGDSIRIKSIDDESGSVVSQNTANNAGRKRSSGGGGSSSRVASFFSKFRRGAAGSGSGKRTLSSESSTGKTNVFASGASSSGGGAGGSILDKSGFTQSSRKLLAMEGYLTKGGLTRPGPEGRREPWERRYFTLTRQGLLYFYRSRQDFRAAPKAPLNNRPLNLSEYYITFSNSDETARQLSTVGSDDDDDPPLMHRTSNNFFTNVSVDYSVKSKGTTSKSPLLGGSKHVFELVLVLRDEAEAARSKQWVLRCDTEEELDIWVACMRDIAPDSFRE